jgi:hypothetical protein
MMPTEDTEQIRRRLQLVRWVALADFLLLALLLTASFAGARSWVSLLGPLHGGNFLLLLTLVGLGAVDGLWRWWFPALVLVTGGPLGAWLGEWMISRRLYRTTK